MLTINSVKEFLKLDWKKIVFVIVFLFLSTIISGIKIEEFPFAPGFIPITGAVAVEYGFPLKWLKVIYGPGGGQISYLNLLADLIFWYLISCLIIFAWNKIKNKKQ